MSGRLAGGRFGEAIPTGEATAEAATEPAPIPMVLTCPSCGERHIDRDSFAVRPHHTHACQHCGLTWRPAIVPTVGVEFLPGFKNVENWQEMWEALLDAQREWMFRRFDEGLPLAWVRERVSRTQPACIVVAHKDEGRWKTRDQTETSFSNVGADWVHAQLNEACGFVDPDRAWP